MKAFYTERFLKSYTATSQMIQRAVDKQLKLLLTNFRHPSLQVKKYGGVADLWQGRINRDWRFYFKIEQDTYQLIDVIRHPK